jgi:hypothetical protein
MKKTFVFSAGCGLAGLLVALVASAQTINPLQPNLGGRVINGQDLAATAASSTKPVRGAIKLCANIEAKIQIKISSFDANKARQLNAYLNMKDRLVALNGKLVARGLDTSDLQADLVTLDGKINKFAADYKAYIDSLRATKNYACGQSQGQFVAKLKEAKTLLLEVHKDVLDIRSFYVSTIKPDLQEIKKQISAQKSNRDADDSAVSSQGPGNNSATDDSDSRQSNSGSADDSNGSADDSNRNSEAGDDVNN